MLKTWKFIVVLCFLALSGCRSSFSCYVQKDWAYDARYPEPGVTSRMEITLADEHLFENIGFNQPVQNPHAKGVTVEPLPPVAGDIPAPPWPLWPPL